MANAGFSAAVDYFGPITGLTAKESSEGKSASVAEASNSLGDTVASDVYGSYAHPSTTYAVTASASSFPALGSVVGTTNKYMITSIAFNTSAGQPPSVTISGEEVPTTVSTVRTYAVSATILPRCKAQDVASLFTAPAAGATNDWASINTTFSVNFVNQTVAGNIVAACPSNGRVESQATLTSPDGAGTITLGTGATGAILSTPVSKTAPDTGYVQVSATATKFLSGSESNGGSSD